jgi:crotonobetainyl-CoA:carnitine CoA-transferase CaiB-like acyl-CoA transferase
MFETMVYFVMAEHLWGNAFEPPIGKAGYTRLMSHHRKPYKTLDGYIAILPYMDSHWETFCRLTERLDLLEDPRFTTLADRVRNIDDTYEETGRIMATRTTAEWLEIFDRTSVPTIVVNSLEDLVNDPHLKAVGFWQEVDHPTEGRLRMTRLPMSFSATPTDVRRLPPRLGEHSVEILREAGYDDAQIERLVATGVTRTPAGS